MRTGTDEETPSYEEVLRTRTYSLTRVRIKKDQVHKSAPKLVNHYITMLNGKATLLIDRARTFKQTGNQFRIQNKTEYHLHALTDLEFLLIQIGWVE